MIVNNKNNKILGVNDDLFIFSICIFLAIIDTLSAIHNFGVNIGNCIGDSIFAIGLYILGYIKFNDYIENKK